MKKQLWLFLNLCAAALAYGQQLTPQQLQTAMAEGEKMTLIDLRPQEVYAKGTLPNAVRMGVREAAEKNLVGKAVFFDDGLSVNRARRAVETFAKAGKAAAELAGGYAAWRAAGLQTSEQPGVAERLQRYVTYQDLTGAMLEDAADVVLVDVREVAATPGRAALALPLEADASAGAATNAASAPLDLAAELPAYRITREPVAAAPQRGLLGLSAEGSSSGAVQPLYILIDSGDGQADKKAAELRSSGCARVSVLAGGEAIIRRKGEPGLVRRGPGTGLAGETPGKNNLATLGEEVTP